MEKGILTAKRDVSYIHIEITPTPEINIKTRDLMQEITKLARERLGESARVRATATINPKFMVPNTDHLVGSP